MKRITSRHNPLVARYRAVARGDDQHALLLEGPHLVAEALAAGLHLEQATVAADRLADPDVRDIVDRLLQAGVDVAEAGAGVMNAISAVRSPSALVALAGRPREASTRLYAVAAPLVVIAINVQDPGNLGAMVRVAEAGGATGTVAAGTSADPFGWKALRGSMGSAFRLPAAIETDVDRAIAEARRHGCRIVAAVPRGGRLPSDVDLTGAIAILIGGEGPGLASMLVESADERVTIPVQPPVESLNAAVAAALLVYEARRQRPQRQD